MVAEKMSTVGSRELRVPQMHDKKKKKKHALVIVGMSTCGHNNP